MKSGDEGDEDEELTSTNPLHFSFAFHRITSTHQHNSTVFLSIRRRKEEKEDERKKEKG